MYARIIIFEGPDGVGKTTLINHFRKEFKNSYYMHLRVHKDMKLWHTASMRLAIKKKNKGKLVLIDRHWPSEQCYSYIYRDGPSYDARFIYDKLKTEGTLYVWCSPENTDKVKANHRINREEREEEYYDIDKVVELYDNYWHGFEDRENVLWELSPLKLRNDFIRYDMLKEGDNLEKVTDKIMDRSFTLGL
jgi:thymidylate kinase